MAPTDGYWGPVTSTLDWCEENYVVLPFIAEFWNTISNLMMIIPPLCGAVMAYRERLEARIIWCHLGLLVVGIGSWFFHMTLLYSMQLLDELPMIWGSAFMVYAYATLSSPPQSDNTGLKVFEFLYCSIVTIVYLVNKNPVFHEVAYGLMVFSILACAVRTMLKYEHSLTLFLTSTVSYGIGFLLWNVDNTFCGHLRYARKNVLGVAGPVTELHAWWHVLAGFGTYLSFLFVTHTRYLYLKKHPKIKFLYGIAPYVTVNHVRR
ncbi:alkaline ceramidase 3-like [Haliotis rubra]|uniref:alkaline ceramidase 3-like n=1 Tax=Haliotis rubra TaxID=36100 RepID=UPI001EE51896|nr:alkaline ceramidase 3-like [Haliotis rubra]